MKNDDYAQPRSGEVEEFLFFTVLVMTTVFTITSFSIREASSLFPLSVQVRLTPSPILPSQTIYQKAAKS
jgi:hypothetical protein